MKKLFYLFLLLQSFVSFSQQITLDKGKFYVNGNQISSRETRQLLSSNVKAITLFNQAKSKEGFGGLVLGFGIALTVGDLASAMFSNKEYPSAMTYVGVGSIIVSIPILSGRKRRIKEAIALYNKENNGLGATNTNFQLNAIANQNGMGIQINF